MKLSKKILLSFTLCLFISPVFANQKYFQESMARIREQLSKTRATLTELKEPLEIISTSRSKIEARKMELLGAEGLIDTPYEPHHDEEIPMLVEKLKSQLSTQVPSYIS
mgnify:CR=1 FL=1